MNRNLTQWEVRHRDRWKWNVIEAIDACQAALKEASTLDWELHNDEFLDLEIRQKGDDHVFKISVEREVSYHALDVTALNVWE